MSCENDKNINKGERTDELKIKLNREDEMEREDSERSRREERQVAHRE